MSLRSAEQIVAMSPASGGGGGVAAYF